MRVNFFVIAPPGLLADFPATFVSAFRVEPGREPVLNELSTRFPNVTLVDVAAAVRQAQLVIDQLIEAVQFVFLFTLAAGVLVLYSALLATEDERRREAALMRVCGASRAQVAGSQRAEFLAMGVVAGLLATLGAAGIGQLVARKVFELNLAPSIELWLAGPLAGIALLSFQRLALFAAGSARFSGAYPARRHMSAVTLGDAWLTIEELVAVARGARALRLNREPAFRERIERGAGFLKRTLDQGASVYGVNTGYGDSCVVSIPPHLVVELPAHLVRYHGCGSGERLDEAQTLAVLMARLCSLARGYSGVRWELLERLEELVNRRILPCIPAEGSVGASGDLTPLSYVAAALIGEREVSHGGSVRAAAEVLREAGLAPLALAPKEGLAIMNGTAVMTGSPAWHGPGPSISAASPRA
jgi:hypothetical protein